MGCQHNNFTKVTITSPQEFIVQTFQEILQRPWIELDIIFPFLCFVVFAKLVNTIINYLVYNKSSFWTSIHNGELHFSLIVMMKLETWWIDCYSYLKWYLWHLWKWHKLVWLWFLSNLLMYMWKLYSNNVECIS